MISSHHCEVVIIGAGPYGLSLAAHLRARQVNFRIFGRTMDAWRDHMPEGMWLKSDGFASNLHDSRNEFTLAEFCRERGIEYHDKDRPVSLSTFVRYGVAFKDRFAPDLDERLVAAVTREKDGFLLTLDDGARLRAQHVVVAVGVSKFLFLPPELASLPADHVSHSYDHHDLTSLADRKVAVIGGGASAIDLAGLLKEKGGDVRLICRRMALKFGSSPGSAKPSLWGDLRHPPSGLGPGWRSRLCTDAPLLFHVLPAAVRRKIVRTHLGPAASWRMREKVVSRVPVLTGHELVRASVKAGRVELLLRAPDQTHLVEYVDHVVAATGYRVDMRRLGFLDPGLLSHLVRRDGAPALSTRFESSVRGLFFIGPSAADSFGPLMRFAFGAGFAARRVTGELCRRGSAAATKDLLRAETSSPEHATPAQ